jgi:periplasmic divalent cation tolerance protein
MMSGIVLIYSTWPNAASARQAIAKLLEDKLIACANIISSVESHFLWDDKIHSENECIVIMKSKKELYKNVENAIISTHPYSVPAILCIDSSDVFSPFEHFILNNTSC